MAEIKQAVGIDIKVNGQQAIQTLGQLEDETKKFNDELKKVEEQGGKGAAAVGKSMVDLQAKFEDVYGEMQPLSGRIGEMEDRMYELALAGQQSSDEFKALQGEVSRYKQVIIETDREVDKLTEQGKLLGGALEIGSTVTAGYGAVQGAMALVGNENEELMQSMVKLQAAQSVLAGIEQMRMNLTKQSLIVTKFQSVQNWVLAGSTTALAGATTVATTGMKLFRLALIATGIGAIVVGLGLLIANFDKVSEAVIKGAKWVQGLAKEFREMGTGMQTLIGILSFGLVPAISYAIKLFEDMGVVDDEETRKFKANIDSRVKDIERQRDSYVQAKKDELAAAQERFNEEDSALNHQMALMQAAGKSTIEIEGQILQNKRDSTIEQIALTEEILAAEYKANLEILRLKAQTNDLLAGVLKAVNKEIDKAGGQDAYIKALIGTDKDLNEVKDTLVKTEQAIEIHEVKVAKIRRDAAEKEKDWRDGLNEEVVKGEMRKAEAIKTVSTGLAKFDLDLWNKQQQEKKDKQKKADEEELARKLDNIDNVNNAAQQGADFLSNLNSFLSKDSEKNAKREFQINKAKDLAGAVTNTAKGVTQALASSPPPLSFIQAAGVGILGGANIARIASARYNGGASGGGAVSIPNTASGVGGADVGAVTNTTTTIGGDSKVFVVEQDITNTQNKIQVLENQSKL